MSQRDLTAELRASRIAAPYELRERVRLTAGSSDPARRRFTWRRALVIAVPVAAAIAASIVFIRPAHERPAALGVQTIAPSAKAEVHSRTLTPFGARTAGVPGAARSAPAPSGTRAQRYGASLTLRIATATDVSNGIKRALHIASSLGGYSVSVHASTKAHGAAATLALKVPRTHVQEAVSRLAALGTITAEQVDVQDLQTGLNTSERTIARLQQQLAALRAETQTPAARRRMQTLTAQVQRLQRDRATTIRTARYATIDLRLATPAAAAPAKHQHGPLHGLGVAFHWIGIGAVYAFALGAPLVALIVFGCLGLRAVRRRREDALLSRR